MEMRDAPFYQDVAEGPSNVQAYWLNASDGVRIRAAIWPNETARGTVFMFPGRTEYVEKYGRAAQDLIDRGFAVISIDWRGQGLADRLMEGRSTGHVGKFSDYQLDVTALLDLAAAKDLPKPWFVIGHSMGGCIGLRAVYNDMPVAAAAFTGPMWGIQISPLMRPIAWITSSASSYVGLGHRFAPGTGPATYVLDAPFAGNSLTTDPDMYLYMQVQMKNYPDLALGGPSMHWLFEALKETNALARLPAPDLPCVTYLGTDEQIVDNNPIYTRMQNWPKGRLEMIQGGQHEVLMEDLDMRTRVFDDIAAHFSAQT